MTLDKLPSEIAPPPGLEDRTLHGLRHAGFFREAASTSRPARWLVAAAALLLFTAGAVSGAWWTRADDVGEGQPRYMLLLYGATSLTAGEESEAVVEYRRWAGGLREQGRHVSGERLAVAAVSVPPAGTTLEPVQGYFLVSAASLDDAVRIAESSPHVRRGGTVVVRKVDTDDARSGVHD